MKIIEKKILILVFTVLNFTGLCAAVQDSLILYTKPDCSNCRDTKLVLNAAGINFIEKTLNNEKYAEEMLHQLSIAGFHKEIYLPVIFLNKQLLHPAWKSESGLVQISLQNVVDSLKKKFLNAEINPVAEVVNSDSNTNQPSDQNSDCELKVPTIFLVCGSYDTETEAKKEMNQLISDGYSYAGIIFYQNKYRVFSRFYSTKSMAENDLLIMKKIFQDSYLFEMQ